MGRPTKLTSKIRNEICKALELAVPLKYAAEAAGIAESTIHDWMARGEAALGSPISAATLPYATFFGAVTRARARAVIRYTEIAIEGGKGSSNATWFLERRFRSDYGPVQRLEHTGAGGKPISIEVEDIGKLTDDELAQLAKGPP